MYRITYWLVYCHHYYVLALGLLRFRYDFAGNQALTTKCITFYSIAVNVLTFVSLPWIYYANLHLLLRHERGGLLVVYVFIATKVVRVSAVLLTIIYNWQKRAEIMAVIRDMNELRWQYFSRFPTPPELQRIFEIRVIRNILSGLFVDVANLIVTINAYKYLNSVSFIASSIVLFIISNLLYMVMNQYYFAIQTVNLFGHILNRQLLSILKSAKLLAQNQRHRRFSAKFVACCRVLSHDLDELAVAHVQLQSLAVRINEIFKLQGLGVLINMFIFNISLIFTTFSMVKSGEFIISRSDWIAVLMVISSMVYLADLWDFLRAIIEHIDVFRIACVHLELHTPLMILDSELERSLAKFRMQLSINIIELQVLGLFTFNSEWAFSMFAAVVMNSILIMQFDYQYFQ